MEVPKTFVKEKSKEATQEEIEELIKKTLVDKVLVENIAQELAKRLESEMLAKRMSLKFQKTIKLEEEKKLDTETEKYHHPPGNPYQIRNEIRLKYETKTSIFNKEASQVLEKIIEIEPNLKEDEIIQKTERCLNILSKDVIYELSISYLTSEERKETGKTDQYQKKIYKRRISNLFKKKAVREVTIELPLVNVYQNFTMYGEIKYVKFNFEHNAKILKALKGLGYEYSVNIIEEKCKK
ncbi:MAG: hypothetical protein Q8O03_04200 [Nanoarchaeota archaeon]|nr:hypothetical protein [Nanoarchaeota archaeon]